MIHRLYKSKIQQVFPILGLTAGHDYLQENVERPAGLNMHQVFIVRKGNCELSVGGQKYILEKNDMFFVAANVPHSYKGLTDDFATSFLGFDGNVCERIFEFYQVKGFQIYTQKNTKNFLTHLIETLELFRIANNDPALSASTYASVIAFFDDATKKELTPIEKVNHYLKANYAEPISLADILEFYPYSKSKLCQDFVATYGISIFEKLTDIRLSHAHNLLSIDPSMKLKALIEACGFNDMSYFCKMYRKKYNKSPKGE